MGEVDVLGGCWDLETGTFGEAMQEFSDICIKPSTILWALIEQRAHIGQQLSQHLMAQANLPLLYEVIDRDQSLLCHIDQGCPPSRSFILRDPVYLFESLEASKEWHKVAHPIEVSRNLFAIVNISCLASIVH